MTFPFTWALRGPCKVIHWSGFNIVVFQGIREACAGRERDGGMVIWRSSQNTHNICQLSSSSYVDTPKQYNSNIKKSLITDHHNKNNDIEKIKNWNTAGVTKTWHRDMKWENAIGDMVPRDVPNTGLPQTFNLQKAQYLPSAIKWSTIKWGVLMCLSWMHFQIPLNRSLILIEHFLYCHHTVLDSQ